MYIGSVFKLSVRERLEQFFKIPFEEIINDLHLKQNISLNGLFKRSGVSRQAITILAKRSGLRIRSIQEATALTKNKGSNHWAFGKTKETCIHMKNKSELMIKKNPSFDENVLEKAAIKKSKAYARAPFPQETVFLEILESFKVKFIFQYPIKRYIIDFFIPSQNLCVEIDSTEKWGKERRGKAAVKDKLLRGLGYKVLRIDKRLLCNTLVITDILQTNNIIG